MDPLSVIASVAGIATAAGEVIKILGPYTTATKDAPKIAAEVSAEALATQTILTGLEQLINNFSTANVRYASLIQVDQLTAVLFDGVKIFSELLAMLQTLPPLEPSSPGGSLWTPIQWVRKKSSLTAILHRLQAFKSSIVCILSILQSKSRRKPAAVDCSSRYSTVTHELNRIKAALSKDQDYETNKVIWGLGKLLMFDKVDIMDSREEKPNQLYVFEKGILQTVELSTKDRRRGVLGYGKPSLSDRPKAQLLVIKIIPGKDIKRVQRLLSSSRPGLNGCEIKWFDDGRECSMTFTLRSKTQSLEWMYHVIKVKDKSRLGFPLQNLQRIAFINPFDSDEVDYCKEETHCRSCVIDNEVALINVTDTTGQEEYSYSTIVHQSGRVISGFMLVYSVTSRQSFEEITAFYHEILRDKDKDRFPMVIVGNQCFRESPREVTTQEGEALARELGCTFVEVDAKSRDEVDAAFFELVWEVRLYNRNMPKYR
ncbi:hypothetical protein H9Q70_010887 [Fusarium xylarioides]|nr:hypothetical protein H9Q70_010887 [Fusarium xylarioides]